MAELYFNGKARWAKLYVPDEKFGPKYSIELQLDEENLAKYKAAGCMGNPSKDGEGYYTFRRTKTMLTRKGQLKEFGPPKVLDKEGQPTTVSIGNGSDVTIKVETYPTEKGVGTRLVSVRVDNLVEYNSGSSGNYDAIAGGAIPSTSGGHSVKNPF